MRRRRNLKKRKGVTKRKMERRGALVQKGRKGRGSENEERAKWKGEGRKKGKADAGQSQIADLRRERKREALAIETEGGRKAGKD